MNRFASPIQASLSRRAFLGTACVVPWLSAGLAACGRTYPPRPSSRAGMPVVDVHCHLFNASDLPVRGFAQRVVLGDPEDQVVLGPDPSTSRAALPHLAGLLVELLSGPAPTARAELAAIDRDGSRVLRAGPPGPESQTDVERVRQALQSVLDPSPEERAALRPVDEQVPSEEGRMALARAIEMEVDAAADPERDSPRRGPL